MDVRLSSRLPTREQLGKAATELTTAYTLPTHRNLYARSRTYSAPESN
jgi:hypothetical protein